MLQSVPAKQIARTRGKLVEAGDFARRSPFINASVEQIPEFFFGIGYLLVKNFSAAAAAYRQPLPDPNNANFTMH